MAKKVMVVDDEQDMIFIVKAVLEEIEGEFEVMAAKSGEECLSQLENNPVPDLILLDVMMPEMSGWILYYQIKDNPSWENIPIVFLTARIDKKTVETGTALGDDFIKKPFDGEDLKRRINTLIKKREESPIP